LEGIKDMTSVIKIRFGFSGSGGDEERLR